jgi:uncharacterized protein (TIGR04255 family)
MMSDTPKFTNPPVVELVIGAQFSPLTKLTAGHFGWFWKQLAAEWTDPSDGLPLEDQFEVFDQPRWAQLFKRELKLEPFRLPGRFMIGHRDKHRLIQIQATRFHLNWRKKDEVYPSYSTLIADFEALFARFVEFAETSGIGSVAVNQWELTYIDAFAQGEYWQTPTDWPTFLPGLFGNLKAADGLVLETRAAEWSYEIAPKRGRLHLAANLGRTADGQQPVLLLLHSTARGPVGKGGADTLRAGLDLGHNVALETFLRVTSEDVKARWGKHK